MSTPPPYSVQFAVIGESAPYDIRLDWTNTVQYDKIIIAWGLGNTEDAPCPNNYQLDGDAKTYTISGFQPGSTWVVKVAGSRRPLRRLDLFRLDSQGFDPARLSPTAVLPAKHRPGIHRSNCFQHADWRPQSHPTTRTPVGPQMDAACATCPRSTALPALVQAARWQRLDGAARRCRQRPVLGRHAGSIARSRKQAPRLGQWLDTRCAGFVLRGTWTRCYTRRLTTAGKGVGETRLFRLRSGLRPKLATKPSPPWAKAFRTKTGLRSCLSASTAISSFCSITGQPATLTRRRSNFCQLTIGDLTTTIGDLTQIGTWKTYVGSDDRVYHCDPLFPGVGQA